MTKALKIFMCVGIALMASSTPLGLVGIWSGDERWGWSGALCFLAGLTTSLCSGITISEMKARGNW